MNRYSIGTAIALVLAGCGGGTSAAPQSVSNAQAHSAPKGSSSLVYILGRESLWIMTYPRGKFYAAASLDYSLTGICSDSQGNVFVDLGDDGEILEYVHGSTYPIGSLEVPTISDGCAVDPTTNNLAVASGGRVEILANEQQPYTSVSSPIDAEICAYDANGDLFISNKDSFSHEKQLAELPKGANQFAQISVPSTVGQAGALLGWDGQYMAWEDTTAKKGAIYQLSISGSQATIVGKIPLGKTVHKLQMGELYNGQFVATFSKRSRYGYILGTWAYPTGGEPVAQSRLKSYSPRQLQWAALTVSVPPSK